MRCILIHGFNSAPDQYFYPWLKEELIRCGHAVLVPSLALVTGEQFQLGPVLEDLSEQVGKLTKNDILIGHSLSSFVALQFLDAFELHETPRAVVCIAPPCNVLKPELRPLFLADLDADVLMWKAREIVVIHSKDDELVPWRQGKELARMLKASWIQSEHDGHFMNLQHPTVLEALQRLIQTPFLFEPGQTLVSDFS